METVCSERGSALQCGQALDLANGRGSIREHEVNINQIKQIFRSEAFSWGHANDGVWENKPYPNNQSYERLALLQGPLLG